MARMLRAWLILGIFSLAQCWLSQPQPARFRSQPRLATGDGRGSEDLEAMRRLLEVSWNADTMGEVPSNPEAAANEAYGAIMSASEDGKNLFFVDLLLPSYEKGERLYDEVLAVEYCIALSSCLKGKSEILVRDEKTFKTVRRVLDARERNRDKTDDQIDDYDSEDEDEEDNQNRGSGDEIRGAFARSPSSSPGSTDVDAFRRKLISNWDTNDDDYEAVQDIPKEERIPMNEPDRKSPSEKLQTSNRSYRLASMFGDEIISRGSDMPADVVRAIQTHALPYDEEENIIILSAISREEMVAIRSLVDAYEGTKRIIMVNCKLDPMPRELLLAETVYSILPLMAKPTGSESRKNAGTRNDTSTSPKVVVLRRYPRDWEIYVDMGRGFELAKKTPADKESTKGPSMEFVADSVQEFLESNSN